jgi:serine protease Do
MKSQTFCKSRSQFVRFVSSGLLTVQVTIATSMVQAFITTMPGWSQSQSAQAQGNDKDPTEIYKQASRAVVLIETDQGSGSGAIIAANGLIVTNAHVVEGAKTVRVTLRDGRQLTGEVISMGSSDCLDLALVKVSNSGQLPIIPLAAQNSAEVGMQVLAIGNPLDTTFTLTDGIISNLVPKLGRLLTNVRLNPGNSGGPLLNRQGQLVGIIKGGYHAETGDGINMAVAVEQVLAMVQASQQSLSPTVSKFLLPGSPKAGNQLAQALPLNGIEVAGRIQSDSNLMCQDQSRANLYTFQGQADQPFMLQMSSADIGSFLMVLDPNGRVVAEAGVEKTNQVASILKNLSVTGTYTVIANAAKPEQLGRYSLRASQPLLVEAAALTDREPRLKDGSPYRSYRFTGKAGQVIDLALRQFDFDPFLAILDAEGKEVVRGKAKRQGTIQVTLPHDGSYELMVSTVNPSDRGQFFLSIHLPNGKTQPSQISQR